MPKDLDDVRVWVVLEPVLVQSPALKVLEVVRQTKGPLHCHVSVPVTKTFVYWLFDMNVVLYSLVDINLSK